MSGTRSYRRASLSLSVFLACATMIACILERYLRSQPTAVDWSSHTCHDAEALLTAGGRLPLGEIDMYSLELINGVSDTLAAKILVRRRSIMRIADYLRPGEKHRAFEVIHGIGLKTAQKLARYVDPIAEGFNKAGSEKAGSEKAESIYNLRETALTVGCPRHRS